jgi:hypothetical protein
MNHYQVHHNFFHRLAEWFILNLNPHGELNLDAILGSNPAESNNSYRKKAKDFGTWDINTILNLDDLETNAPNTREHTKMICRGMPIEFALFMDRNYPNFFEECFGYSTQLMYVPAVMKTYQFWLQNRERSLFPRTTITIPTAPVNPVLPAAVINRENNIVDTLRDQLNAVTTQRDRYQRQRNLFRTQRDRLTTEKADLSAKLTAAVAERDAAIAERDGGSSSRDTQRHSQAISKLRQENDRLQNSVTELQRQLEELKNKNEQVGIHKNVTQE